MKSGEYTVFLCDDGTMDTVIDVQHPERFNGESQEIRYSTETAADYRIKYGGALDLVAFVEEVVIPDLESDDNWGE